MKAAGAQVAIRNEGLLDRARNTVAGWLRTLERTGGSQQRTDFVVVYVASGQLQAHVVKEKLESEDIPVLLEYESAGPVMGVTVGRLGEVRVKVPEPLADKARDLLGITDEGKQADSETGNGSES